MLFQNEKPTAPIPKASHLLTRSLCKSAGILPLSINDKTLEIAAMNPNYAEVRGFVKEVESKYKLNVRIKQISSEEWEQWYARYAGATNLDFKVNEVESSSRNIVVSKSLESDIRKELDQPSSNNQLNKVNESEEEICEERNQFNLFDSSEDTDSEFEEEDTIFNDSELNDQSDPVINAVGKILSASQRLGASDIHVEPLEVRVRIRYRVDGVLKEFYSLPKAKSRAITSRIKVMSKLDIAEKRLPQDGRIRYLYEDKAIDLRVSTLPGKWGEKIVLRVLKSDSSMLRLEKLITSKEELRDVRSMGKSPYGIFIVVGPTGSGKSTTLYSILNERNTPDVNISTVEDPVEYTLEGIHQVQVIREKGLDFARALRSLMRQDPDIILVGETRDKETAHTAMEAALTGHMVFTTLHANDTSTAITRLAEMGIPPYLIGSSVIGVMAQRLIRKVCPKCSFVRETDIDKDQLAVGFGIEKVRQANVREILPNRIKNEQLDLDNDICPECNGAGYKGRLGLYEVMRVNDPIRELIMKSSTADLIRECAFKSGMKSLLDYGLELVKNELTTLEEVERVCLLEEVAND